MYDEQMVAPMRREVTDLGVSQLMTSDEVDTWMGEKEGTALIFVNSVCGCAAGGARPGLALALGADKIPDRLGTVFAGQDREATEKAREYFVGYPPSSPQMALFRNGEIVLMLGRHDIEGRMPIEIANRLAEAFAEFC
jgi:putative YphP/YqiW family bacilliredoxin